MTTSPQIRVLIADDHQLVRQGLRTFLELHPDVSVVGEASDGLTAVDLARQHRPDIVLMDLVMPRLDGAEAIRQITALAEQIRVIVLTSFAEDDKLFPAIQAGASSYLLKDVSPDDLIDVIRAVHAGQTRLHPEVARKLMDALRAAPAGGPAKDPPPLAAQLTERERQIARLVAHGQNNREIAQTLVISDKTVKTHISNILGKLKLADRTQLAIYAIKNGLAGIE